MKLKLYSILCLVAVVAFSCKKDLQSVPKSTEKTYPVQINVASSDGYSFAQAVKGLATASVAVPAPTVLNNLIYLVYDSSGALVRQLQTTSSQANFGTINDNLPSGTYSICVFGNIASIFNSTPANRTLTTDSFYINPGTDGFKGTLSLTVGTSSVTQSLSLTRLDGKLTIKSSNAIPNKIDSLQVSCTEVRLYYVANGLPITTKTGVSTASHVFTPAERGTSNFQLSALVYYNNTNVTITEYYQGAVIKTISIPNVKVQSNYVSLETGNVFVADQSSATDTFQLSFSTDWNNQTSTF